MLEFVTQIELDIIIPSTMSAVELDHIVIAAETLSQGNQYIHNKLGVHPSAGGRHPGQGTHNSLLRLDRKRYLEIIALDPDVTRPNQPRWFNLDDPKLQEQINTQPKVITWVARTADLDQSLAEATYDPGHPQLASRGSLRWRFTFSDDGDLIEGGLLPHLIEWETESHPSRQLPQQQVFVDKIHAFHPDPKLIYKHLKSLGLQKTLSIEKSSKKYLQVTLDCPAGKVTLS